MTTLLERSSGVLAHVTSLPGPGSIGDLGPSAHAWVDLLSRAQQAWWQILPLGPPGYGNSPYQCLSAFAGNPLIISHEPLGRDGLLAEDDLPTAASLTALVDFEQVKACKSRLLERAWDAFQTGAFPALETEYAEYCRNESAWLEDYALFAALKERFAETSWLEWPDPYRLRQPTAIRQASAELAPRLGFFRFTQFLFSRQWKALRSHAHRQGVRLMGDLPIFVATDSADVWSQPELFQLDDDRRPIMVAGVPPDYFSATGQLWGNPTYRWDIHRRTGFTWWVDRLRSLLSQVDMVRLDHFRGFQASWEVPAGSLTAEVGHWTPGPGEELFEVLRWKLGELPFVAEDLGVITPEVDALRARFELPGMRILQFAYAGAQEDRFLPHNYTPQTAVYTGTHDNETTLGWYANLTAGEREAFRRYAPCTEEPPNWRLIRLAWASVANLAIAPLQDVLGLGNEARMNLPGQAEGNWRWRAASDMSAEPCWARLSELTEAYQRVRSARLMSQAADEAQGAAVDSGL